jgi:protein O-GlcNAc transferase
MRELSHSRFFLRSAWFLPLLTALSAYSSDHSLALRESTRALYRRDYLQAAQIAEKRLRQQPADAPVRVILGRVHLAQGNFRAAFDQLKRALAADPHNIDALYYLSLTARQMSQEEYQRLFALAPDSERVHQLLAEAALAAQDPSEAEREFKNALNLNPHSSEVLVKLAELKRSQSKFDEAIDYYLKAEHVGELNYDIAYGLGACYTYRQEYRTAAEWLRKAVDLAPDSAAGQFALGNVLFQSGQYEASIPMLKISLQLEPGMKQAYFLLGRAYAKLGRQAEAQAAFNKLDQLSRSPGETKKSSSDRAPRPEMPQ